MVECWFSEKGSGKTTRCLHKLRENPSYVYYEPDKHIRQSNLTYTKNRSTRDIKGFYPGTTFVLDDLELYDDWQIWDLVQNEYRYNFYIESTKHHRIQHWKMLEALLLEKYPESLL